MSKRNTISLDIFTTYVHTESFHEKLACDLRKKHKVRCKNNGLQFAPHIFLVFFYMEHKL
jgi:hypothetical protein